jgi:NitT/TauT family transport system permease protein
MSVAGLAQGTQPGSGAWRRLAEGRTLPVMTVVLIILALWYAAAVGLNAPQVRDRLNRSGQPWSTAT